MASLRSPVWYGMLENGFQTLLSEPLTAFIPSKIPCQKEITFDLRFLSELAITPRYLGVLENSGPRMDCQRALGHDPWGLPAPNLGPLHHQHVVGEGCPEPEALQRWLCFPLFHLLYLHSHLVAAGLRNTFRVNCKHRIKQFHLGKGCTETSETPRKELHHHDATATIICQK